MNNKLKRELFSVPNILTYFRIILIPVFVVFYVNSAHNIKCYIASVMVLIASGLTDMLDGKIARKYDQITELGKILDPVADKLSQCAILACLLMRYRLFIPVLAIFVIKEITMAVLALVFYRLGRKLKGAHWYGKDRYKLLLSYNHIPFAGAAGKGACRSVRRADYFKRGFYAVCFYYVSEGLFCYVEGSQG